MAEIDLACLLVALVHREVDDPAEAERVLLDEIQIFSELDASPPGQTLGRRPRVADEEHRVAVGRAGGLPQGGQPRLVQEARDRPLGGALGQR